MIHQYKQNGYNIVIDAASGAVHSVDDVAYDIIGMYCTAGKEEIIREITAKYDGITEQDVLLCMDDIEKLKAQKQLFCEDTYEDKAEFLKEKNNVIKALCLHVAHTCNLNCRYCFAGQGKKQGKRAVMSLETGKQAIDFLIKNSGTRKNLEVDFFGGEPLMNFEVVKEIVKYARSKEKENGKNFRFTITTNGLLLNDENIDFINAEMSNVVLSLDGRRIVNDNMPHHIVFFLSPD